MTQSKSATDIVQGNFFLKHLVLFTKCTSLCSDISLYLKNDYPIIVEYNVAGLGEIKLALAPALSVDVAGRAGFLLDALGVEVLDVSGSASASCSLLSVCMSGMFLAWKPISSGLRNDDHASLSEV